MENLYIVGAGTTVFGRHTDRSVKQLVAQAESNAGGDANIGPKKIQAAN